MRLAVLLVLFFTSGACALAYEVVWIRLLGLTLSVTVYALTTVLCAFMAGLALGAAIASRFADRVSRPLALFGAVELLIAVSGVIVPGILLAMGPAYVWIRDALGGSGLGFVMMRFLLAFVVLLVPTTLMGVTLPLLSRAAIQRGEEVGSGAGALYASNTLGAVVGTLLAGFVTIPAFGLTATSVGAASFNVLTGGLAIVLGWSARVPVAPRVAEPAAGRLPRAAAIAAAVFAVSGFTAMGYEVLWTRALEHFTHNSTYAYTAMLATFLAGIALGSAVASRVADRARSAFTSLGLVQIGVAASVLVALAIYMHFEELAPFIVQRLGGLDSWWKAVTLIFLEALLTLFVTTLCFGATFPLVARVVVQEMSHLANRIATAYTANTVGSILGALLVGFVVLPTLGVRGSFVVLIAVNALVGGALVLYASRRPGGLVWAVVSVALAVAALVVIPSNLLEAQFQRRFGTLRFYREEVTDTVMVTEFEDGERMIRFGDGRGTAGTHTVAEDRAYAHVPMLLHPAPRRVLQIAFGVGNSLSSVTMYPIEEVVCVELSPGVADAAPWFERTNRNVLADPRVRLVIEDGRNYLLGSHERYDVIRLDPPELHTAGVVNLYTREFYELARDHLAPGGIFSIWVNSAMTPEPDLRMLVRTLADVFPYVSVWRGPAYYSWVMNGSMEPRDPDLSRLIDAFSDPKVGADLRSIGIENPYQFLALFLFGNEGAERFADDSPPVTDDHTRVDFSVPRSSDSYFGIANSNTDHWLFDLRRTRDIDQVRNREFLQKLVRLGRLRTPVADHVDGIAAAGLERAELARRVEAVGGRAGKAH